MTILTPATVFARDRDPPKAEIVQLLDSLFGVGSAPAVVKATKTALDAITPSSENVGGLVLNDTDPTKNGYYYRSSSAWVKGRGFPDTFARVTLSGAANAQSGAVAAGVNPAEVLVYFAEVATENTGPMTLTIGGTSRAVVNAAREALSAGEWADMVVFFVNGSGQFQLLFSANAVALTAANVTAASGFADDAEAAAVTAVAAAAGVEFPVSYAVQDLTSSQRAQARENLQVAATLDSVADMVAATRLAVGQYVATLGYYSPGDGGGNLYEIVAAATETEDGGAYIDLEGISGQAKALFPHGPNLMHWGAKLDNSTDDTAAVQAAFDWAADNAATLYGCPNSRLSTERRAKVSQVTWAAPGSVFDGQGMIFVPGTTDATTSLFEIKDGRGRLYNFTVAGGFADNYQCGIHWYTNDLNSYYPGRLQAGGIIVSAFAIGLVIGGLPGQGLVTHAQGTVVADGVATNAPLSECFMQIDIQDCPRGVYMSQPNGKVTLVNSNVNSEGLGYIAENGSVAEIALTVLEGELSLIGGCLESVQTSAARLAEIYNLGHVNSVGQTIESREGGGIYLEERALFRASNALNWGVSNNGTFVQVKSDWIGECVFSDMFLRRGGGFSSQIPVVKAVSTVGGSFAPCLGGFVTFNNVEFGDVNWTIDPTYNPILQGVRGAFANCMVSTQGGGADYTRAGQYRLDTGPNLLTGLVDTSAASITTYGTNGNATSGGWGITVSGTGAKDWGSTGSSVPAIVGETPSSVVRINTSGDGNVTFTKADIPVEEHKAIFLEGLVRTNNSGTGRILFRASYETFASASILSVDGFDGVPSALANTDWTPVLIRLGPAPANAAKMDLVITAEAGAELYFANLRLR